MTTMLIIHTTLPCKKQAKQLVKILLESRLCACVQRHKIKSQYIWEEKLCKAKEYLLIIKTLPQCKEAIQELICTHHSYQTPEILSFEATTHLPYFQWLDENIQKP